MKNERLFRILGLIDEELIEEAAAPAPAHKKSYLKPMMGLAACLAVVCLASLPVLFGGGRKEESAAPQSPEGGYTGIETEKSEPAASDKEPLSTEETSFMSYAGPVFPMTILNETDGLTAERNTVWDFAPRAGHNGSPHQWGASVTDNYVLTNHTTGEILAMVMKPDYDPNDPPRADVAQLTALMRNTVISDAYEPGSTFKIITTAAALETGVTRTSEGFYCSGATSIDGSRIRCWGNPHGAESMAQALENSCNPVFVELGLRIGTQRFYEFLSAFGFGRKTGVDIPAKPRAS